MDTMIDVTYSVEEYESAEFLLKSLIFNFEEFL